MLNEKIGSSDEESSKPDYHVIEKSAIVEMYDTVIKIGDRVNKIEKDIKRSKKNINSVSGVNNEIVGWIRDLEERFALVVSLISGKLSKQEFEDEIGDYYSEDDDDDDEDDDDDDDDEENNKKHNKSLF